VGCSSKLAQQISATLNKLSACEDVSEDIFTISVRQFYSVQTTWLATNYAILSHMHSYLVSSFFLFLASHLLYFSVPYSFVSFFSG
jgi:predicted neutral ceramidase superfamily lipid hydrolase